MNEKIIHNFNAVLTLEEVKRYLKILHDYEDENLILIRNSAIKIAEGELGFLLSPTEVELKGVAVYPIILKSPLVDFCYFFINNAKASYYINNKQLNSKAGVIDAKYISGLQEVPQDIKLAILMNIEDIYEKSFSSSVIKFCQSIYQKYKQINI